jgi:hypothetical protein
MTLIDALAIYITYSRNGSTSTKAQVMCSTAYDTIVAHAWAMKDSYQLSETEAAKVASLDKMEPMD